MDLRRRAWGKSRDGMKKLVETTDSLTKSSIAITGKDGYLRHLKNTNNREAEHRKSGVAALSKEDYAKFYQERYDNRKRKNLSQMVQKQVMARASASSSLSAAVDYKDRDGFTYGQPDSRLQNARVGQKDGRIRIWFDGPRQL